MAEINLIKNLEALISVRVPLKTVPTNGKLKFTNGKLKFDSKNNDSKSNYSNSSGNNNDNNNNNNNNE